MALLGSMYLVAILGIKLHDPQQIKVPNVGNIHPFNSPTPVFDALTDASSYFEGLTARLKYSEDICKQRFFILNVNHCIFAEHHIEILPVKQ